ncbi:MAG: tRNA glutamyl-Q(34) synthetase GluQRS [Gammaproteobacteria bacterium]|nr:tRNA glutamyl-Q(34) synthetase GluQRS [Gammaproteobacteria bacterium]MBA3732275.1 tRNA glutamyl-Q(34) synthetase GluQRS [Gammaproteobacteria bacterium]
MTQLTPVQAGGAQAPTDPATQAAYIGRFAPSPTGPLHFGSLIAAVGSYLQARSLSGLWRVRIEDIDPPREQPGAAASILRALEVYGFRWDGDVMYQSRRKQAYLVVLKNLVNDRKAYYCNCTRRQVEVNGNPGALSTIYAGTCRSRDLTRGRSLRVITHNQPICFDDQHFGRCCQHLEYEVGDFLVSRADGFVAYHLAVVVDDAEQGITQIVRGADLLDTTARHIHLQQLLHLPTPDYLHLPVAVDRQGFKLSKQTRARPLSVRDPVPQLIAALALLNHRPPAAVCKASLDDIWHWAITHWAAARLPKRRDIEPHDNARAPN